METLNRECLGNRDRVGHYVFEVGLLPAAWLLQSIDPLPLPVDWDINYCVDIYIQAFVPPVLTPGQDANVPIDIRVRFSDGVELPDQQLSVAITATDATVTPAGGIWTTPVARSVTLRPAATTTTLTLTAAFANPHTLVPVAGGFEVGSVEIGRPRTASFTAGAPPVVYPRGTWSGSVRTSYSRTVQFANGDRSVDTLNGEYLVEFTLNPTETGPRQPVVRVPLRGGSGTSVRTTGTRTVFGFGCLAPNPNLRIAASSGSPNTLTLRTSESVEGYLSSSATANCDLWASGVLPPGWLGNDQQLVVNNEVFDRPVTLRIEADGTISGSSGEIRIDRSRPNEGIVVDLTVYSITWSFAGGQ